MAGLFKRRRKIVKGVYRSTKTEDALTALNKKKTLFMWLSCVFYVIPLLAYTGDGLKNFFSNPQFLYAALIVFLFGLAFSVSAILLGRKKHKMKSETDAAAAPYFGFKKTTYISYEIFTWWHIVALGVIIGIAVIDFKNFPYVTLFVLSMAVSAVLAILSRQILYKEGASMTFIKAEPDPEDEFYAPEKQD